MFSLRSVATRAVAASSLSTSLRSQSAAKLVRLYSVAISSRTQPSLLRSSAVLFPFQRRWASDSAEPVAETQQEPEAEGAASSAATAPPEPVVEQDDGAGRTVFVGNISWDATEQELQELFSKVGKVESVTFAVDRSGQKRGFGWIRFDSADNANSAAQQLNQEMVHGRPIGVQISQRTMQFNARQAQGSSSSSARGNRPTAASLASKPREPPSDTLFIGNLSYEMTDVDLNNLFQPIKNVVDVRVAIDRRTGQPRGFAHADFVDIESAQRAMEILQTKSIYGRQLRVDFSKSYSRKRMERDLNAPEEGQY